MKGKSRLIAELIFAGVLLGIWSYIKAKWQKRKAQRKHNYYGFYEAFLKRPLDLVISS